MNVALALTFQANTDTRTLSGQIQAGVFEFINSLPVNGPLYIAALSSVLQRFVANGLILNSGTIVAPVGDLVPPIGQTLRTNLSNIVIS